MRELLILTDSQKNAKTEKIHIRKVLGMGNGYIFFPIRKFFPTQLHYFPLNNIPFS